MKKNYVNPRCNKFEVVEQNYLLQTSTTTPPTGFVVGGEETGGINVRRPSYLDL